MTVTTAFPATRRGQGSAIKVTPGKSSVKATRRRPVRIAILARGNAAATYASTKRQIYSKYDVSSVEGFGCPAHLIVNHLFDYGLGDIPVTLYPLDLTGTASAGDVTPSGTPTKTQTYYVEVSNILSDPVIVEIGDSVADIIGKMVTAINAVQDMPVIASDGTTTCDLVAKWHGAHGDNIYTRVIVPEGNEISFAFTQLTGGAGTPDITAALAQIVNIWETHIITDLDYTDSTELAELQLWGQGGDGYGGRRDPQIHKPARVFTGAAEYGDTNAVNRAAILAVTDARKTDKTNIICHNQSDVTVDGRDLPCVIAANWAREVAKVETGDPAMDYIGAVLSGLTAGSDIAQWENNDDAMKKGCCTIEIIDGEVRISDTVTCYHPTGEEPPLFQYVCDLAKDDMIINELDITITPLKGRPLIPDIQASANPNAIKPKTVRGMLAGIANRLGLDTIISDPDWTIDNSQVGIGTTNPKRLDVIFKANRVGNANTISMDVPVSFYFGG